jgi:hypothetical protein
LLYINFGVEMAPGLNGVGMRAVELAAAIGKHVDVTLVTPDVPHPEVHAVWPDVRHRRPDEVTPSRRDVLWYGFATEPPEVDRFKAAGAACVFDAIVWPLEYLTYQSVSSAPDPVIAYGNHLGRFLQRLRAADCFTVASEMEKQVIAGMLSVCDHARLHGTDPSLDEIFFVLPVGLSETNETTRMPAGTSPTDTSPVFVWNGGLWNHYEPVAAIEALAVLARTHRAQLWLLYPQRGTPTATYRAASDAAAVVAPGTVRFFHGGMSLTDRVHALRAATASIALYRPHALWDLCPPMRLRETLLYRLPIIAPRRGALGDLISTTGIGVTTASLDPDEIAKAMLTCLSPLHSDEMRAAAAAQADVYTYERRAGEVHRWISARRHS